MDIISSPVTFVDISAMRADLLEIFTKKMLNNIMYTLSPSFVEISNKMLLPQPRQPHISDFKEMCTDPYRRCVFTT